MPPVIIFYLAIATFIFGCGYGTAWKVENRHIAQLEAQIAQSSIQAGVILSAAENRTAKAESDAANTILLLESEHVKATQSINNTRRDLADIRLRDPGRRKSCADPVPSRASSSESETSPDPGELSKELAGFLREEAYRADTAANYANACYTFVAEQNCGIKN